MSNKNILSELDSVITCTEASLTTLRDCLQQQLVLFFYPKDNTPGCSKEAQAFGAAYTDFQALNTNIIGVSRDSMKSHVKFIDKFSLPYPLISDVDSALCDLFEVIKQKSMMGRTFMGIERSTFILSPRGEILNEWRKVKVKGHVDAVLEAIKK